MGFQKIIVFPLVNIVLERVKIMS